MRFLLFLCVAVGLSACANVWIKSGASDDDLAQDKAECNGYATLPGNKADNSVESSTEALFEQCMADKGWWHPGAVRTPQPVPATQAAVITDPPKPENNPVVTPAPTRSIGAATADQREVPAATTVQADTRNGSRPTQTSTTITQSWRKFGGRNNDLARDQKTCREQSASKLADDVPYRWGESAAFDQCMRDLGWRGP